MEDLNIYIIAILVVLIFSSLFLLKVYLFIEECFIKVFHRVKSDVRRDYHRVYGKSIKEEYSRKCHYRCEGIRVFLRCKYQGRDLQGDHWFPYSRGGKTSPENLVMLCSRCNKKKTNHVPTFFQTKALELRRKRGKEYNEYDIYKPGEWLDRKFRREKETIDRSYIHDLSF